MPDDGQSGWCHGGDGELFREAELPASFFSPFPHIPLLLAIPHSLPRLLLALFHVESVIAGAGRGERSRHVAVTTAAQTSRRAEPLLRP